MEIEKVKVVTICGSMKFKQKMREVAFNLEKENGWAVIQCVYNDNNLILTDNEINKLILAHYKKILISDVIFVVNENNYIGEQVKKEIEFAKQHNKEIMYLTDYNY